MVESKPGLPMLGRPILGYWNIRGLAQPARFLLEYLNIYYDERRYQMTGTGKNVDRDDWLSEKFTLGLTFPNIPYWIDEEVKVTESRAILKHIARKYDPKLLGLNENINETVEMEMVESFAFDLGNKILVPVCYYHTEEIIERFNNVQPTNIKKLSEYIGSKNWIMGDNITYVDFWTYEVLHWNKTYDPKLVSVHDNLISYMSRFEKIPQIAKYIESDKYIKGPCFSPSAIHLI